MYGVLGEVVEVVLEELVIAVLVEFSLGVAVPAVVNLVMRFPAGPLDAAFEDGARFLSKL